MTKSGENLSKEKRDKKAHDHSVKSYIRVLMELSLLGYDCQESIVILPGGK